MQENTTKPSAKSSPVQLNRREFLVGTAATATASALFGMPATASRGALASTRAGSPDKPNILTIIVDEMRFPQWFPAQAKLDAFLPNIARIRQGGVEFQGHYAAATACSPSRGTLLTGLYAHQTGVMLNQNPKTPSLNPQFKTWGHALRDYGYSTNWYGKWHLSTGDTLEPYGFDGGTYPSPNGGAQNGTNRDPGTADQFVGWFDESASKGPWATTVSLLNPHDIMFYPDYTDDYLEAHPAAKTFSSPPPNIETAEQLVHNKPRMQKVHQDASDDRYGDMPTSGDNWQQLWTDYLNAYLTYQCLADEQIGRVLDTLDKNPAVRDNTIIVFYSDHGEYGGSHGLRAKGGAVYEESIHVPLIVKDPTGRWTAHTQQPRMQLTSVVDTYGLLLTLASGNNAWRANPDFAHVAGGPDIATMLHKPNTPGRDFVLHTSDSTPSAHPVPTHVIGYRTNTAKIGTYSYWKPGTGAILSADRDVEVYDYTTEGGRQEIDNSVASKPKLYATLDAALTNHAIPTELRKPLTGKVKEVSDASAQVYYDYVEKLGGKGSD